MGAYAFRSAPSRLSALSSLQPRQLALVLGLSSVLAVAAAAAPSTLAAPEVERRVESSTEAQPWSDLLARIVPPPSRRPPPHARFNQTQVVSLYGFPGVPVMGALGESSPEDAARRAQRLAREHQAAAPGTRVVGALHLIVGVAEVAPGADGTYLSRLDAEVIERYLAAARAHDLLLFLDVQVGWADPLTEVQRLERFLVDPDVQVALDPEFATRAANVAPGKVIGTLQPDDVNRVQHYLAGLVREHGIPPKLLVLHQFLDSMLARPAEYDDVSEVEIAIDMDGYGSAGSKLDHYNEFALAPYAERPGIKLFYKWDVPLLTPADFAGLARRPGLVIYQ
ncbi:MAG: hypothetical protein IT299_04500 [Dehalococcoidia bacterium]|nr:hypothetical protein [Dehalococcoidia bacterium]